MSASPTDRPLAVGALREALELVLTELIDLGTPPVDFHAACDYANRLGGLQASIKAIIDPDVLYSRTALTLLREHVEGHLAERDQEQGRGR